MIRRLAVLPLLLGVLACLMGAGTIAYDPGQPSPNPGGVKGCLGGAGTYTIPAGEMLTKVEHIAMENALKQTTYATAGVNNGKWTSTMFIAAGIYNCQGRISTIQMQTGQVTYGYTPVVQNVNVQ